MKNITITILVLIGLKLSAQINEPPFVFSVDEFKEWTQDGPTADPELISTVPLAERFENIETQFNPELSNAMEIAYLPDGMNNFGAYIGEQSQFNLYNFTNWAYIDKLVWFGGTASETVAVPSAVWSNTAHQNGVKVFGNVFFAPNVFGGSTETILNFLELDGKGGFVVIPIMLEMMEYYKFDGWFINQETNTNSVAAGLMYDFLKQLTAEAEALGKEVMWYDAMLLDGNVNWQNRLTSNNSPFVQNDEDGDSSNGFEERVSSNIFINFSWNNSSFPESSRNRAETIGRTSFEVFTGVDVWPGRNQARFQTGGNTWMSQLHETPVIPYTSFGVFAPSCLYNNDEYSNFDNDPLDYESFYSSERHMFSGADRNPGLEDASGFKGFANWIPAASTITEIPFETNFNTGHGLKKFTEGLETSPDPWHLLDQQDILPTWQFAFSEGGQLSGRWDFDNAYNGGSSLRVQGNVLAGTSTDLLLYKTKIPVTSDSKIDVVFNPINTGEAVFECIISFTDAPDQQTSFTLDSGSNSGWLGRTILLEDFNGREIATIGFRFIASENVSPYAINIGNIKVHNGEALTVPENSIPENVITLVYPNTDQEEVVININWPNASQLNYALYSLDGKKVDENSLEISSGSEVLETSRFAQGVYILKVEDEYKQTVSKKLIVR